MHFYCVVLGSLVTVLVQIRPCRCGVDDVIQEIDAAGFKAEILTVQTQDGYQLGMVRLPAYGRSVNGSCNNRRGVFFVMHCLFCNCGVFVTAGPRKSLAFVLSDAGYDVYLGNARGTLFSRRHKRYSDDSYQFWDFSLDEIGQIDVPTMIEFTLRHSGVDSLHYIGYSMGGTSFFIAMETHPELNLKLKSASLLAPAAIIGGCHSDIAHYLAENQYLVEDLLRMLGFLNLGFDETLKNFVATQICDPKSSQRYLCHYGLYSFTGPGLSQSDRLMIPHYIRLGFDFISIKQLGQYGQMILQNKFQMYQYRDRESNMRKYNSINPPEYLMGNISVPIVTFFGTGDGLVSPNGSPKLYKRLKTLKAKYLLPEYNHIDFVIGRNMDKDVYKKILQFCSKFD